METDRASSGLASSTTGILYIDCGDLVAYLRDHTVVSGIQRVLLQALPGLAIRRKCRYVLYSDDRGLFVSLDSALVEELLQLVRVATREDGKRINSLAKVLLQSQYAAHHIIGSQGDVLLVLGAPWVNLRIFSGIQQLRAQQVAVATLVHDLIPVIVPGFPENDIMTFRSYLSRVAFMSDRVMANSRATRDDFEKYCSDRDWAVPPGGVTQLAADQWQQAQGGAVRPSGANSWPRPFALFVATVEVRKNHILALRAWRRLITQLGEDAVPDLVCVGRLGWECFEFLEEYHSTNGLNGKVFLLDDYVSDSELANLYRDCLFTVYPSRYEGWGLPVTESLMSNKPCLIADSSSLPEAGGDFATYFKDNDVDDFVVQMKKLLDPEFRAASVQRIITDYRPPTWDEVSARMAHETDLAVKSRRHFELAVTVGREYGLGTTPPYVGDHLGKSYLAYLNHSRRLPLTQQIQQPTGDMLADLIVRGGTRSTVNGRPVSTTHPLRITFPRPQDGPLQLVLAWSEHQGSVALRIRGPLGEQFLRLPRGGACNIPLGSGIAGREVSVEIGTPEPHTPILASFCVVPSELEAQILVERRLGVVADPLATDPARAVDPEVLAKLEYLRSSWSWRATRPIRRVREWAAAARDGNSRHP